MTGTWEDASTALRASAYSLKALAVAALPLMENGGSIVGLTFDAKFAWPVYDWMGVAKAAFESTNRYLARDLGPRDIRANLVAAGPIRTTAAKSIPGFERFEEVWDERAPLGWNVNDPVPAARACAALLSDWFPATTGEIVHVDGGVHAMGQLATSSRFVRYASSTVRTSTSPDPPSKSHCGCPGTWPSSAGMRRSSPSAVGCARHVRVSRTPRNANDS